MAGPWVVDGLLLRVEVLGGKIVDMPKRSTRMLVILCTLLVFYTYELIFRKFSWLIPLQISLLICLIWMHLSGGPPPNKPEAKE
jgi:hypothetical protein